MRLSQHSWVKILYSKLGAQWLILTLKKVISKVTLTRAVVDSQTVALNKELQQRHLDPNRKVFYCGSWSCDGLPILESAVTSAMHIAEILGAPLPFVGLKPKVEVAPELGY